MSSSLIGIGGGLMNGAVGRGELVVVDDECPIVAAPVGVGKDILIHRAVRPEKVIEQEILALSKQPALVEQRSNFAIVTCYQSLIRVLLVPGAAELHAVLLSEALDLTVAEHGQARQSRHHGGYAEEFVAVAKLVNRRAFIRIAHKVDVKLWDVRLKLD